MKNMLKKISLSLIAIIMLMGNLGLTNQVNAEETSKVVKSTVASVEENETEYTLIEGGIINTDVVLTKENSPYRIVDDIQIGSTGSFKIQEGVILDGNNKSLEVHNNLLQVKGTEENNVIIKNLSILGIVHGNDSAEIEIEHTELIDSLVNPESAKLTLKDSILRSLDYREPAYMRMYYPEEDVIIERNIFINYGVINVIGWTGTVYIKNNLFEGGDKNIILDTSFEGKDIVIKYNSFNPSGYAIFAEGWSGSGIFHVDADNNYWGTTNITEIEKMIYDRNDNLNVFGVVKYDDFLENHHIDTPRIEESHIYPLYQAVREVEKAENSRKQVDFDNAKSLVDALGNSADKTDLLNRLNKVQNLLSAIAAIEKAEGSKELTDVTNARELIYDMEVPWWEYEDLLDLLDRLDKVELEYFEIKLKEATTAVETAEYTKEQLDLNTAHELVRDLEWSNDQDFWYEQNSLYERLELLQSEIDERQESEAPVKFIRRLGGTNREGTAVLASQEAYADGANAVVLAGFGGDVDALTGTLLAADKDAPLLITRQYKLSESTKEEILRLGAHTVYILGGENAVNKNVENEIKLMGKNVIRISGANRYATAANVAKTVMDNGADHAFLVLGIAAQKGGALADALAIGPVSANKKSPVLLTQKDRLPKETIKVIKDLGVKQITIVGGTSAVSLAVEKQIESLGISIIRVFGSNRANTALAIANKYFIDTDRLLIANGHSSADALVGGYLGNKLNAPILLATNKGLSNETNNYINDRVSKAYVLGGKSVVSEETFNDIKDLLK